MNATSRSQHPSFERRSDETREQCQREIGFVVVSDVPVAYCRKLLKLDMDVFRRKCTTADVSVTIINNMGPVLRLTDRKYARGTENYGASKLH